MIGLFEYVLKPLPHSLILFAPALAAAITEGSSIAIGIEYNYPFIKKFKPKPSGYEILPIQFSTIKFAFYNYKPPSLKYSTFTFIVFSN